MTPAQEIRRFLTTGDHDTLFSRWPGPSFLAKAKKGDRALGDALVAEVRRREKERHFPSLPPDFDSSRFVIEKVGPMVRGLFPAKERETVLELFENSLVFVTRENIEQVLNEQMWLKTAWDIANLYLGGLDASGLDGKRVDIVGLSEATTFFVSTAYFKEENPFADYVVHEAAHVFHNWKRERAGLPYTRNREWLLGIDYHKRELFAYACEAYSRILEQAKHPADRRRLHADYCERWLPDADRFDQGELVDVTAEAVSARNGWKRILHRCSPARHPAGATDSSA